MSKIKSGQAIAHTNQVTKEQKATTQIIQIPLASSVPS